MKVTVSAQIGEKTISFTKTTPDDEREIVMRPDFIHLAGWCVDEVEKAWFGTGWTK